VEAIAQIGQCPWLGSSEREIVRRELRVSDDAVVKWPVGV
jgi:hypothetical protein